MSLSRTVAVSSVAGTALAACFYLVLLPGGSAVGASPVHHQSVPTPTVTRMADCVAPAVLEGEDCVTHVPGAVIVTAGEHSSGGSTATHEVGDDHAGSPGTVPTPATTSSAGASHEAENHDGEDDAHESESPETHESESPESHESHSESESPEAH